MKHNKDKDKNQCIIFLGLGSYELTKAKKSTKGLFWTFDKNHYYLLNNLTASLEESSFSSYKELLDYCEQNFPESHITT